MAIQLERFRSGDVYIDYPFEEMMFHYVHQTGRVFRKFYGTAVEDEIPTSSEMFVEATSAGTETTAERYAHGEPRRVWK